MTDEKGHQMADHEDDPMDAGPSKELPPAVADYRAQLNAHDILAIVDRNARQESRFRTFMVILAVGTALVVLVSAWLTVDNTRQNRAVIVQLEDLVESEQRAADDHSEDNQANHDCIIDYLTEIADRANARDLTNVVNPCPPSREDTD